MLSEGTDKSSLFPPPSTADLPTHSRGPERLEEYISTPEPVGSSLPTVWQQSRVLKRKIDQSVEYFF